MAIRSEDIPSQEEADAVREAAGGGERRKKSWLRWPVRVVVVGLLLLVVAVVALPTVVSSGPGTDAIVERINARIPGTLEVGDLRLAWLKGQGVTDVRLLDPDGAVVASVGRVAMEDVGLIGLLRGSADLGVVAVERGVVELVQDAQGRTNLDAALGTSWFAKQEAVSVPAPGTSDLPGENDPHEETGEPSGTVEPVERRPAPRRSRGGGVTLPADLSLQFALRDVTVSMTGPTIESIRVELPEATLSANGPSRLGFTLDAAVQQGGDRGAAELAGSVQGLFDERGRLSLDDPEFDVEGLVDALPLTALDRLAGGEPRFQTVVGPTLDAELRLKGKRGDLDARVVVTSERLNVDQAVVADPTHVTATGASRSTLVVTPASWAVMTGGGGPALVEPFTVELRVDELEAPYAGTAFDLPGTKFAVRLGLAEGGRVAVDVPERGRVAAEGLALSLRSEAADRVVALGLNGDIEAFGAAGPVSAEIQARRGESGWNALTLEGVLTALPVPVLDAVLGQGDRLTATFGERVGMGVLAVADGEGGYALTADFDRDDTAARASSLSGQLSGSYTADGAVTLRSNQPLRLTVSPEAFAAWQRPVAEAAEVGESVGLTLPEASEVTAILDLKTVLTAGPGGDSGGDGGASGLPFDPRRTSVRVDLTLPETQMVDEWYHRRFALADGRLTVDATDLARPVSAELSFRTIPAPGSGAASDDSGRVFADTKISGLLGDHGLQPNRASVNTVVEFDRVPTVVFDALIRQQGYAVAAFGEQVSTTVELDGWELVTGGDVAFEFQSANGSVGSFRGTDDGSFFVPDGPITFHLQQTPELAGRIMRWVNPILLPAVRSATVPLTITIDDDTFRLPTRGFSWEAFDADVQVQMGTVRISTDVSPVNKILPPLQAVGLIDRKLEYDVLVSPITLSIRDGVFTYEDLTFRIGDVTLPFSGRISFVDQSVDLRMGLEGRAVEKNPWIGSLVGEGIAIGGTVKNPVANFNPLQQLQDRPAETIGNVLGDLLGRELRRNRERDRNRREDQPTPAEPTPETQPESQPQREPSTEEAIGGLIGDLLGGSRQTGRPAEDGSDAPEPREVTPEQAIGGFLGDLLERELRRARDDRERERQRESEPAE